MMRGEIWNVILDPSKGSEQAGFHPCVIVSPDSMNQSLQTVITVPLTTKLKNWPTRVDLFIEGKAGQARCEQIRTISKERLHSKKGELELKDVLLIKLVLMQMLFD